jgi:hypothetical protein
MRKLRNRLLCIIHGQPNSRSFEFMNGVSLTLPCSLRSENYLVSSWLINTEVRSIVLICMGMSANYNRIRPSGDNSWNILNHNRRPEDSPSEPITNRAIW